MPFGISPATEDDTPAIDPAPSSSGGTISSSSPTSGGSISGAADWPGQPGDGFPNFMQFQFEGIDLGEPDATTLNFTGTGISVTRGTGENANTVTVSIPPQEG